MGNAQSIIALSQSFGISGFCDQGIFFKADQISLTASLTCFVIFVMTLVIYHKIYSDKENKKVIKKQPKGLSRRTIGIALSASFLMVVGCIMAADLFTYFICFQILLLVSYVLVVQKQTQVAMRVGNGYLTYGLLTGMVMLMGMFILSHEADTTTFETLTGYALTAVDKNMIYLAGILFLIGFGCNIGIFPIHTWMDRAYQEMSSLIGGYFASIVTKAGLVGVWMMSDTLFSQDTVWHTIIISFGLLTLVIGCIRSFLSTRIKEVLAFVNMASMGALLVGVGAGANILYPMVLQMIGSFLVFAVVDYLIDKGMEEDLQVISKAKTTPVGTKEPGMMLGFAIGTVLVSGQAFWMSKLSEQMVILFMLVGLLILVIILRPFMILFTPADEKKQGLCSRIMPKWLSLEKFIYEPLMMHLVPFICSVILRACDKLVDGIVIGLRKTIFKDKKQRVWDKVGTPLTYVCGIILDEFVLFLNKTFFRKNPIRICFVNELAYWKSGLSLTSKIVVRSVSFGLLMFCIGLCLTLGYLLVF